MRIYIGLDRREEIATEVCEHSIRKQNDDHVIRYIGLDELEVQAVYEREYHTEHGVKIDNLDGRPFSTEFAFSRFLVPYLCRYDGWALFCDADFLFKADPAELIQYQDPNKAVMVVKHNHAPGKTKKMDGQVQSSYERKNWSSLIYWNCSHPENKRLGAYQVNNMPGFWLHQFRWLRDNHIGELPESWNWLADASPTTDQLREEIKAIHYTSGGPWFEEYKDCPYAEDWLEMKRDFESQDSN